MWYTILNFCDDFPFFLGCLGVIINMSRQNVEQLLFYGEFRGRLFKVSIVYKKGVEASYW